MNDKYYQPDISEFHVGFEYEEFHDSSRYKLLNDEYNKWNKKVVDKDTQLYYDDISRTVCYLDAPDREFQQDFRPYFRVKYLDREDIEEYFDIKVFNEVCIYGIRNGGEIKYEIESFGLPKHHMYKIWWRANHGDITFFTGQIKNKSELKRLLQQLKILE
jgi:hypothetical protein